MTDHTVITEADDALGKKLSREAREMLGLKGGDRVEF